MCKKIFTFSLGALLTMAAVQAQAAELIVPTQHATISAAVQAAAPGDTIRVTNAGPFAESIVIDKAISLVADPGVNPVLTGDPDVAVTHVIRTADGAEGASIGSIDGGKFIIDQQNVYRATLYAVRLDHSAGLVNISNFDVVNTTGTTVGVFVGSSGSSHVKFFNTFGAAYGFHAVREIPAGATHTVEYCRFLMARASRGAVYLRGGTNLLNSANFTFRGCEMESHYDGGAREALSIYGGINGLLNFENCWIRQTQPTTPETNWMTVEHRPRDSSNPTASPIVNYSRCVFEHRNLSRCINVRASNNSNGIRINIDHCDFIQENSARACILVGSGTDRQINVTNTLFNNTHAHAFEGVETAGDTYTISHVNANTTSPTATTFLNATATNVVDPPQVPNYANPAAGNFTYTTPVLLTADSTGGPLGSMLIMADALVPPPNRARYWSLY